LCLLVGIAFAFGAALALGAHMTGASTTYVEGDWRIDGDTTLANGTWVVNGSVTVGTGTLRLEDAELVLTSTSIERVLRVNSSAQVVGRDSTLRGTEGRMRVEVLGAGEFTGCSFSKLTGTGISSTRGRLVLDECDLSDGNTMVSCGSTLRVSDCTFEGFYWTGVAWQCDGAGAADMTVTIEGSTFVGGSANSVAVRLDGFAGAYMDWNVTVRGCTLRDANYPIDAKGFSDRGRLAVENNTAQGCTHGARFRSVGTVVRLSGNTWAGNPYDAGLGVEVVGAGSPTILYETIIGGSCGLSVSGGSEPVIVRGLRVDGASVGVMCFAAHLDILGSHILANVTDFSAQNCGMIHIQDCNHSHRAEVQPRTVGEVRELVPLRIESVSWQDGTPAYGYELLFLDIETGIEVGSMTFPVPRTLGITSWLVTHNATYAPKSARARLTDPMWWYFYSSAFDVGAAPSMALVIYDHYGPIVLVYTPSPNSLRGGGIIEVSGEVWDYGTGMGSVLLRIDLGDWMPPEVVQGRYWSSVLTRVPDGAHCIDVLATDRVGNGQLVSLYNVTMDSTPPFILIRSPSPWVNDVSVELVGRTEVGAKVTVNETDVAVDGSGNFKLWVGLIDGPNDFEIDAVDRIRNSNTTTYTIVLDTVPPLITVEEPLDGSWTWASTIGVAGGTDEEAYFTVNGVIATGWSRSFYMTLSGAEGPFPIEVVAVDRAGNTASASIVVHIDQTPPTIDIATPSDGLVTSAPRVLVVGRVRDAGSVNLTVQGDPADMEAGSWHASVDLVEGWNVITVVAEDAAGNRASRTFRVLLDTRAPALEAIAAVGPDVLPGTDGVLVTGRRTVRVLVKVDECGVLRVTGRDDVEVRPGEWEVDVDLYPGRNGISVNFTDAAGNVAKGVLIVIVLDVVPPEIRMTSPRDGTRTVGTLMDVVGETEPGASLTVNGESVEVDAAGGFRTRVHLDMGENAISIAAKDRFGNAANLTIAVERLEDAPIPQGRQGAGLSLTAGLIVGVLALLVVLLSRTRGRPSRKADDQTGQRPVQPGEAPGAPGGVGVRVRRGR
jgi:hypothetical protein